MKKLTYLAVLCAVFTSFDARAEDLDSNYASEATNNDPIEGFNRKIFALNKGLDTIIINPIAQGYGFIVPEVIKERVTAELAFLTEPRNVLNAILSLDQKALSNSVGRLLVNFTFGIGGLFDVASSIGIDREDRDFDLTMKHYGVPTGPYLVLPIIGPSSFRNALGLGVDYVTDPFTMEASKANRIERYSAQLLDLKYRYYDEAQSIEKASLDEYNAYKSMYFQLRGDNQ